MRIKRVIFFTFFSISIIFSIDSDGDGYSDQLELTIGTDPQNAQDRYYMGIGPLT